MLDEAGFEDAFISASNDLDEYLIHDLKIPRCSYHLMGSRNKSDYVQRLSFLRRGLQACCDPKKKMAKFHSKIKLSENTEKITNPGNKTVYRIYDKATGKMRADLICFADETYDTDEDLLLFDPTATWKKTKLAGGSYTMREIFKTGIY